MNKYIIEKSFDNELDVSFVKTSFFKNYRVDVNAMLKKLNYLNEVKLLRILNAGCETLVEMYNKHVSFFADLHSERVAALYFDYRDIIINEIEVEFANNDLNNAFYNDLWRLFENLFDIAVYTCNAQ